MYNDILTVGPVTIHGYGLMIGIGVVVALLVGDYRANKRGLNGDLIYGLTITTVILGFTAAKLLYIITEWQNFIANPKAFLSMSGFVVYGGIIGGLLTIWGYCKWKKMDFYRYLDLMVVSVALAQGFGRLGCFLAGCCYGRPTDAFWGITFSHSDFAPNGIALIPTQLIMSAGDFLIAFLLIWFGKREYKKAQTMGLYLILYSVGRFFVEFLRNDERGAVGSLSTSQFIAIFMLLLGLFMFFVLSPYVEKKAITKEDV